MKHLKQFSTTAERTTYMDATPIPAYPYVHYIAKDKSVIYSGQEVDVPFYFENISGLSVKFSNSYEYSRDGITWLAATSSTLVSFSPEERVYFRASGLTASSSSGIGKFTVQTGTCNIGGNLMSMLYGADYRGKTEIEQTHAFYKMFEAQKGIISARFLALPATALTNYCYYQMFYNCTDLIFAPDSIPATTLASYSCGSMFYGCTSLRKTPMMHVTSMGSYSCYYMFYKCSSLVSAPMNLGLTLAESCCYNMFYQCSSLVSAPELPATELAKSCYHTMFYGCTALVNAPELPATKLAESCYYSMFSGCTSLVNAPELPALTLPGASTVSTLGHIGCYYSMFSGCTALVNAPKLPATTLGLGCYNSMFYGCTALVNAPELPATTLAGACYAGMFKGCTSLVNAPELPATTLVYSSSGTKYYGCYGSMFYGCSSLNHIKAMFTTTPGANYTADWVNGVAAEGTFIKNSKAAWTTTGVAGVPSGWTVETADA